MPNTKNIFDRVIWIVLDGVGAGETPDANAFGDQGANTLSNIAREFQKKSGREINLPHMESLGLSWITPVSKNRSESPKGFFGKALEKSQGKDTTSGHWEMVGLPVTTAFKTFPDGFPEAWVSEWVKENDLPGVLWNQTASGTEIIEKLGMESIRTGKPILYTSADSVWQVAAHEDFFGLERLYSICKSARKICDREKIGRVIARPFVGNLDDGIPFLRTYNRKDYAVIPPRETDLDTLVQKNIPVLGIGKISNIFAGKGIPENIDTKGNEDGMRVLLEQMNERSKGLLFCNLIDFDMLYGHRRDVMGFAHALESFDQSLGQLLTQMKSNDLLIMTADHGNDPTFHGTDHTREYAPILGYAQAFSGANVGIRESFSDIGSTVLEALTGSASIHGKSFLKDITNH